MSMDDGHDAKGITFPGMTDSILDDTRLRALFSDIASETRVLEILLKHDRRRHVADGEKVGMEQALEALLARSVRGAQVRYDWNGADWFDTVMALPEGFRLIRVRHDFRSAPEVPS